MFSSDGTAVQALRIYAAAQDTGYTWYRIVNCIKDRACRISGALRSSPTICIRRPDCTAADGCGAVNLPYRHQAQSRSAWLDEVKRQSAKEWCARQTAPQAWFKSSPYLKGTSHDSVGWDCKDQTAQLRGMLQVLQASYKAAKPGILSYLPPSGKLILLRIAQP